MSAHPKDETLMDLVDGGGPPDARLPRRAVRFLRGAGRRGSRHGGAVAARGGARASGLLLGRVPAQRAPTDRGGAAACRVAWLAAAADGGLRRGGPRDGGHRPQSWLRAPQVASVPSAAPDRPLPAWSPLPPAEEDEGLPVLEGLAASGGVDWDEGRGLGSYLEGLSDEDSAALARALRQNGGEGVL